MGGASAASERCAVGAASPAGVETGSGLVGTATGSGAPAGFETFAATPGEAAGVDEDEDEDAVVDEDVAADEDVAVAEPVVTVRSRGRPPAGAGEVGSAAFVLVA
ncbi:hypothetical protein ADK34_22265, partial [Streptomyces viridochromogenes]